MPCMRTLLLVILWLSLPARSMAQEFRVYTRLYDERTVKKTSDSLDRKVPLSRTTTLFHAGKVYDDVDGGSRITLFEPAHQRFLLYDGARRVRTEIECSEVELQINRARQAARERLATAPEAAGAPKVALVKFQLDPNFQQSFDAAKNRLLLSSSVLAYQVQGAKPSTDEALEAYLSYADWAARLNYLVNPQALLPGPRLALNKSLRERAMLPIEVLMSLELQPGVRLRAVHRFEWKLDDSDRRLILHWERQAANTNWKAVSFAEFQQLTLQDTTQPRR